MFGGEARALGSCVCDAECLGSVGLGLAVHALAVEMVELLYILRESRARMGSGKPSFFVRDVLYKW